MSNQGGTVDSRGNFIQSVRVVTDTDATSGIGNAADPIRTDPTGTTVQPVSFAAPQHVIVDSGGGSGGNNAAGLTGAAVPTSAGYTGFSSAGNLVGVSSATPLPVSLATAPTTPVTGTFFQATQPVSLASAPTTPVTGTFFQATQPVSGTVTANIAAAQTVGLVAGTAVIGHVINDASAAVIGHVIADTGSTTAVTGNVTVVQPTGTNLHVVVDTAPSTAVTNAGTFAVQAAATLAAETTKVIGTVNVAATQTIAVTQATAASLNATAVCIPTTAASGALSASLKSAQATAVNIKASAGNLYGFAIVSATATAGFVQFFNTATTATTGAVLAVPIAASGTLILTPAQIALLNFSTGIAINVATPLNGTTTQITWTGTVWFL